MRKSCNLSAFHSKKASYIKNFALKVPSGAFDINAVWQMPDGEAVAALSGLKGVMQRPNVISFGDLAILPGLRMVYRHKTIDRKLFEKYRKRFSPYGSTASLYLWNLKIALRQNAKCARTRFAVKDRKKQEILSRRAGIDSTKDFPHSHLTRKNCKSKPQIHLPSSMSMPKAFSTVI